MNFAYIVNSFPVYLFKIYFNIPLPCMLTHPMASPFQVFQLTTVSVSRRSHTCYLQCPSHFKHDVHEIWSSSRVSQVSRLSVPHNPSPHRLNINLDMRQYIKKENKGIRQKAFASKRLFLSATNGISFCKGKQMLFFLLRGTRFLYFERYSILKTTS